MPTPLPLMGPRMFPRLPAPGPEEDASEELVARAEESPASVGAADTSFAIDVEDARVAMRIEELVGTRMTM